MSDNLQKRALHSKSRRFFEASKNQGDLQKFSLQMQRAVEQFQVGATPF
jgi:hypothetical protein